MQTRGVQQVIEQVKEHIQSRRATCVSAEPMGTNKLSTTVQTVHAHQPKVHRTPDEPDSTVQMNVDICIRCGEPRDIIRMGSGLFQGKRLLVCRSNNKHPMMYLGA